MIKHELIGDIEALLVLAEEKAQINSDGHLTIMRFTSHWKIFSGTPNLDTGDGRNEVAVLAEFVSLEEALRHFILNKRSY